MLIWVIASCLEMWSLSLVTYGLSLWRPGKDNVIWSKKQTQKLIEDISAALSDFFVWESCSSGHHLLPLRIYSSWQSVSLVSEDTCHVKTWSTNQLQGDIWSCSWGVSWDVHNLFWSAFVCPSVGFPTSASCLCRPFKDVGNVLGSCYAATCVGDWYCAVDLNSDPSKPFATFRKWTSWYLLFLPSVYVFLKIFSLRKEKKIQTFPDL